MRLDEPMLWVIVGPYGFDPLHFVRRDIKRTYDGHRSHKERLGAGIKVRQPAEARKASHLIVTARGGALVNLPRLKP
jgi:hypothetical protein